MSEQNSGDFSVGTVISKSFSTYFRNIIPFTILAVLMVSPLFIYSYVMLGTADITQVGASASTDVSGAIIGGLISTLTYTILTYFAYAAITYGTVRDLQGNPASIGEIVTRGLSTMLPVLGVAFVSGIAIGLGLVLFIIPGIIISMVIYVAVPVAVLEKPGVFESLSRSADLTKGNRWKVLGIAIVGGLIGTVVNYASLLLIGAVGPLALILNLVGAGLAVAISAVFIGVTYQELRRVKEGVDIDTIASVFS